MKSRCWIVSVPYLLLGAAVVTGLLADTPVVRQPRSRGCFFGRMQSVGGVAISPDGALKNAAQGELKQLHAARTQSLGQVPTDLAKASPLRKVSLRRLEAAIRERRAGGQPLDDSLRLLAGLQNVRYVFVVPEEHDIVLAGFAEGWNVDEHGSIVGRTTGHAVLWLEDLLVALRSTGRGQATTITCSIDPTADGLKRLREFVGRLRTIGNPSETAHAIEQVLGSQRISIGGVPDTSHFALVLVAADYRMKRLGMGFEPAPVAGLPSYLQMMKVGARGMQSMTPRWWMVPEYGIPLRDAAGNSWKLADTKVKTLTEETFFGQDGSRAGQAGKKNTSAQAWADLMTAKYDELAEREPIFSQLRGCMQLALVATLIVQADLPMKAGHDFSLLTGSTELPAVEYLPPRSIDTQASFVRRGTSWLISASGGVQIEAARAWQQAEQGDVQAVADVRPAAGKPDTTWWWD